MARIFVDTSAFYALADESDRNHPQAKDLYESLITEELVTTDYVLVECWFLIGSRLGREEAIDFWDGLHSGIVEMVNVEARNVNKARKIIERFPDQGFSLVDAVSFAVMEENVINQAFTFDSHFHIYRFGSGNNQHFSVTPVISDR